MEAVAPPSDDRPIVCLLNQTLWIIVIGPLLVYKTARLEVISMAKSRLRNHKHNEHVYMSSMHLLEIVISLNAIG